MGDEDGVFTVTADAAVFHLDGPVVVFVDVIGGFAETGHGLDTDGVAFDEFVAVAFFAVIGDFGGFVHGFADAMTDVIFDDAEVAFP